MSATAVGAGEAHRRPPPGTAPIVRGFVWGRSLHTRGLFECQVSRRKIGSRRLGCRCFAGAAEQGELVVNATNGAGSLEALRAAGESRRQGADRHRQSPGPLPGHPAVPARLEHGLARGADPACAPPGEGREGAKHDERVRDGRSLARRCRRAHGLRERERRAGQGGARRSRSPRTPRRSTGSSPVRGRRPNRPCRSPRSGR
jgi:hypothetical protein